MAASTSNFHGIAQRLIACVVCVLIALMAYNTGGADKVSISQESETSWGTDRGEYMTALLGCAGCHTEGALEGDPDGPPLAGSRIGIAYTDSKNGRSPGIVFPANLTPDKATGLGNWSADEIVSAIRAGTSHSQQQLSPVMPWANYSLLTVEDTYEIARYLQGLDGTRRAIPEHVAPGNPNKHPFLRIGIYRFEPSDNDHPIREDN